MGVNNTISGGIQKGDERDPVTGLLEERKNNE
jgi:hypothetical protein